MFGSKLELRRFENRILKYVPLYNQAFYYNDPAEIDRYHIIHEGIFYHILTQRIRTVHGLCA